MSQEKHFIIGTGTAALSALRVIKMIKPGDKVVMVTRENNPPYSPTSLPYILSGKLALANIWIKDDEYFRSLGVEVRKGKEAIEVAPERKSVIFADGGKEGYDKLLIATGSTPVQPRIEGLNESDFLGFGNIQDFKKLNGSLKQDSRVAVLGGGLVGVEVAIALLERGHQVTIIEKEPSVLPGYFDEEAEPFIREVFLEKGVKLLTGAEVVRMKKGKRHMQIDLSNGNTMDTDILVCCVGVRPAVDFLKTSSINVSRGILVDRSMKTNIEDIYAAGDVAEAPHFFTGEAGINATLLTAVNQGKVAGANMCGQDSEYKGWIAANRLTFFGNVAQSVGAATPSEERFVTIKEGNIERKQFKKLVFDENTLRLATFINHDVNLGLFYQIIERRLDVSKYRDFLFDMPFETSMWFITDDENKKTHLRV
jgi:phenylglyoxylate dehydrogenase epsilon subunit